MNKLKIILSGLLILLISSLGCKKAPDQSQFPPISEAYLNVAYGTHARNTLDIYLPEHRDIKTPVILLLHGGSWFEGDKSAFTDLAKYWMDKGYAAATMNYRFTNRLKKIFIQHRLMTLPKPMNLLAKNQLNGKFLPTNLPFRGRVLGRICRYCIRTNMTQVQRSKL